MSDIFVVVMAPMKTMPAAVYGPFATKHAAWIFIEDKLGQPGTVSAANQRAYVVRNYGIPENPVDTF